MPKSSAGSDQLSWNIQNYDLPVSFLSMRLPSFSSGQTNNHQCKISYNIAAIGQGWWSKVKVDEEITVDGLLGELCHMFSDLVCTLHSANKCKSIRVLNI